MLADASTQVGGRRLYASDHSWAGSTRDGPPTGLRAWGLPPSPPVRTGPREGELVPPVRVGRWNGDSLPPGPTTPRDVKELGGGSQVLQPGEPRVSGLPVLEPGRDRRTTVSLVLGVLLGLGEEVPSPRSAPRDVLPAGPVPPSSSTTRPLPEDTPFLGRGGGLE